MLLVFSDFFEAFAKDKNLTLTDRRVLCYLLAKMDLQNVVKLTQKEIAQELELARPNLSNSLTRLAEWGYILIQKEGNLNLYQVNQNSALKCRTEKKDFPFTLSKEVPPKKETVSSEKKIAKETSVTNAFNKIFSASPQK